MIALCKRGFRLATRITPQSLGLLLCIALVGCATINVQRGPALSTGAKWVLLPFKNYSETPQAEKKTEAIVAALLRSRGLSNIETYPNLEEDAVSPLPDENRQYERALAWARTHRYGLGVTGSVQEWRYKGGVDAEPAVGLSLQVVDVSTGRILWSLTGAAAGWGRDTVSGTAQALIAKLLARIDIEPASQERGAGEAR